MQALGAFLHGQMQWITLLLGHANMEQRSRLSPLFVYPLMALREKIACQTIATFFGSMFLREQQIIGPAGQTWLLL